MLPLLAIALISLIFVSGATVTVLVAENRFLRRELSDLRHIHYGDVDRTVVSSGDDIPTLTMRRPS